MNVLIIDDEKKEINSIKKVLEKKGFKVSSAMNAIEALDLVEKKNFELILIDILMPIVSGYDLLRLLREKIDSDAKMMFISVVPKKEAQVEGVDGFIQKPFSEQGLLKSIEGVLN